MARRPGRQASGTPGDLPVILAIDDDPMVHDLTERFLSTEGYALLHASSGEEGLRMARESRPSAITLDVMMPGMNGWSTLTALKFDPALATIPVILLTIVDDRGLGYALGASDYLTKPIDKGRLVELLARHRTTTPAPSVLVVEDDEDTRGLLVPLLQEEGWSVREAVNGRDALGRAAEERPSLILLDLMMPEMDGFEFARELHRSEAHRSIPVVVVTAKDVDREDLRRLQGYTTTVLRKDASDDKGLLRNVGEILKDVSRAAERRRS